MTLIICEKCSEVIVNRYGVKNIFVSGGQILISLCERCLKEETERFEKLKEATKISYGL